jgi:Uma2 family endonuclease
MDARHATTGLDAPTLPRHRFTVADVHAMQAAGVIHDGQVELLGGELVTMAAKKNDHEIIKNDLVAWLIRNLPHTLRVAVESTLYLDDGNAPEPDILVYPRTIPPEEVRGSDVVLLVEVATGSLLQDLGFKADLYARHGVPLYWVVDASLMQVHVHADPLPAPLAASGSWSRIAISGQGEQLAVPASEATVSLASLLT